MNNNEDNIQKNYKSMRLVSITDFFKTMISILDDIVVESQILAN